MVKRIKVVKKTEYVPSPIHPDNQAYWKGFRDGQEHERNVCINYFIDKIHDLGQIEGVGSKTLEKIQEFINKEWS